jgi:hypothetical protein
MNIAIAPHATPTKAKMKYAIVFLKPLPIRN